VAQGDVYRTARGLRARLLSPAAARARERRHAALFPLTGVGPGDRVIDVGCGTLGLRGLEPGLDITGVDVVARPGYPGEFVQADATERLPFEDGAFDLAYSNSVIEHLAPLRRRYWRLGVQGHWEEIALLRRGELRELFGVEPRRERVGPLIKSWVAVRPVR
jgi:SAM-dependent methyltransferase